MDGPCTFIKTNLNWAIAASVVIIGFVAFTSLNGIIDSSSLYGPNQLIGNIATDWTNLLIAAPILISAMWATHKGRSV